MTTARKNIDYQGVGAGRAAIPALPADRQLNRGREICRTESEALAQLENCLNGEFNRAVDAILNMKGRLIVTGIGKAGWIGQKVAATFSSTGTPAHFVHAAEAVHGDLGRIQADDIVLILSNSGQTEEVTRLLPQLEQGAASIMAITSAPNSMLAKRSDIVLLLPTVAEACTHRLAPTTSTTCMLALGDALALVVSDERGFAAADFARFHPGGSLGRQLKTVNDVMRDIDECRVASQSTSIRGVLVEVARPGRRTGAVMLTDAAGKLTGIFTDSDLARLLERRKEDLLDSPIYNFMSRRFTAIKSGANLKDALTILVQRKISELPVVTDNDQPVGLIDITDVLGWVDASDKAATNDLSPANTLKTSLRLFQ